MNVTETVTIINKSGKVISTVRSLFPSPPCIGLQVLTTVQGKHLINIFKDAKDAYNLKKAALQAEYQALARQRSTQRTLQVREETRSEASSRHSKSSHRSHRHRRDKDGRKSSRPPLTEHNLSRIDEGSVISDSRRSRKSTSDRGDGRPRDGGVEYRSPYVENAQPSQVSLVRRHTDVPTPLQFGPAETQLTRSTLPPSYHTYERQRSNSVPDLHAKEEEHIDMNLAYGPIPHHSSLADPDEVNQIEVAQTMSRLDKLLLEAHCVQHSASAMISNLQANPEAMAAVALTLAELSNLLAKMSPSIIASLRVGSPAIFALLASPQFLIAGGVALGVTVVMFGGFKIIKKIQANAEAKRIADRLEEPLRFGPRISGPHELEFNSEMELSSIDSWRRGIADAEAQSSGTSVEGEFITPAAAKQNKERSHENARDGRIAEGKSVVSGRSRRTVRRVGSESTIRPRSVPRPKVTVSKTSASDAGTIKKREKGKRKETLMIESQEGKSKKSSSTAGLMVLFKKGKKGRDEKESVLSLRPKTIDM
jgi:hypothetical protein